MAGREVTRRSRRVEKMEGRGGERGIEGGEVAEGGIAKKRVGGETGNRGEDRESKKWGGKGGELG